MGTKGERAHGAAGTRRHTTGGAGAEDKQRNKARQGGERDTDGHAPGERRRGQEEHGSREGAGREQADRKKRDI